MAGVKIAVRGVLPEPVAEPHHPVGLLVFAGAAGGLAVLIAAIGSRSLDNVTAERVGAAQAVAV